MTLRVAVLPADTSACGLYRMVWPAKVVAQQHPDWEVHIYHPETVATNIDPSGKLTHVKGMNPKDYDVLVMQRVGLPGTLALIDWAQAHGIAVVVDADDALWAVHRKNSAWASWNGKPNHWKWMDAAAERADVVTVTTAGLARRYGRHTRVKVMPNRVPESVLSLDSIRDIGDPARTFGWSGLVATHPEDPQVVRDPMRRIVAERGDGVRVHVIGDAAGVAKAWGLDRHLVVGEGAPIDSYHQSLSLLDVGIVPLADDAFNRSKCIDSSTRICTYRGFVPAGDIVVGDMVWRDGWRAVQAVEHGEPVMGVRITTERGYGLDLTTNHRMMVGDVWMEAGAITPGVPMNMGTEEIGVRAPALVNWPAENRMSRSADADHYAFIEAEDSPKVAVTPRWGRFLGAYVGDGSLGQSTQVEISCDGVDQDWINLLMEDIRAFGMSPRTERITAFDGTFSRRRGVRVASGHLVRVLKSLGLGRDRANGNAIRVARVPEVIWRSPRDVVAEFLAGYFEADGTTTSSGVSSTSVTESLSRDIHRLLLQFGITATVRKRKTTSQNGYEGVAWIVFFGRAGADIFEKEIGFRSERKRARLAAITSKDHSNAYRPIQWQDKVVSIEDVEVNPVDIQVEGSEFIAAGFVSHNSSLKALEMSAMGIPVVASPVPANRELAKTLPIILADTPRQWYEGVTGLLDDVSGAAERGVAARECVDVHGWTVQARASEWASIWASAANRRANMRSRV